MYGSGATSTSSGSTVFPVSLTQRAPVGSTAPIGFAEYVSRTASPSDTGRNGAAHFSDDGGLISEPASSSVYSLGRAARKRSTTTNSGSGQPTRLMSDFIAGDEGLFANQLLAAGKDLCLFQLHNCVVVDIFTKYERKTVKILVSEEEFQHQWRLRLGNESLQFLLEHLEKMELNVPITSHPDAKEGQICLRVNVSDEKLKVFQDKRNPEAGFLVKAKAHFIIGLTGYLPFGDIATPGISFKAGIIELATR